VVTTIRRGTSGAPASHDDGDAFLVDDDADLEWCCGGRRADEHRHVGVVGLERSPVMSKCVQHVVVGDTVLAGAPIDVHEVMLRRQGPIVNRC
jgi:hypothetical protein